MSMPSRPSRRRHLLAAGSLVWICLTAPSAGAQPVVPQADPPPLKTVRVDFDATGTFTEADGKTRAQVTPSKLSAAQKQQVLRDVQANFDDAVGKGRIRVEEGTAGKGEYGVVVSGGDAPSSGESGNAGWRGGTPPGGGAPVPAGPSLVYRGAIPSTYSDPVHGRTRVSDAQLAHAIGLRVAHEAAHRITGIGGHDERGSDTAPTKMMPGERIPLYQQVRGIIRFDRRTASALQNAILLQDTNPRSTDSDRALHVLLGGLVVDPDPGVESEPFEPSLDVSAVFTGPQGAEFGYLTQSEEFARLGGLPAAGEAQFLSFVFAGGYDLAVRVDDVVYSLLGGAGSVTLDDPNPDGRGVFRRADLAFTTARGPARLLLTGPIERSTAGFAAVPEPASTSLTALGLVVLVVWRRGGRRPRSAGR